MPTREELVTDLDDAKDAVSDATIALRDFDDDIEADGLFATIAAIKVDYDAENISGEQAVANIKKLL